METFWRRALAVLVAVATFYFVFWIGAALLSAILPFALAVVLGFVGAAVCAFLAARRLWRRPDPSTDGPFGGVLASAVTGALVVGGIGFVLGFFGPIVFTPEANQGPLLGLFITGPLGVVVGAIGGAVYAMTRNRALPVPRD